MMDLKGVNVASFSTPEQDSYTSLLFPDPAVDSFR